MITKTNSLIQNLNDWEWVLSSPNIDPILVDKVVSKADLIQWADDQNIPLQFSVTCNFAKKVVDFKNCGNCEGCLARKDAFKSAGVKDKTKYFYNIN